MRWYCQRLKKQGEVTLDETIFKQEEFNLCICVLNYNSSDNSLKRYVPYVDLKHKVLAVKIHVMSTYIYIFAILPDEGTL